MKADTKTYNLVFRMAFCMGMTSCAKKQSDMDYYEKEFFKAYYALPETWQEYVRKNFPLPESPYCPTCHGTGHLKSYCDAPDPICPDCGGTGDAK